jgi:hypothetical protein
VIIDTTHGQVVGKAIDMHGKRTILRSFQGTFSGAASKIQVIGREEPTSAELARNEFILLVLKGMLSFRGSLFLDMFWFPSRDNLQGSDIPRPNSSVLCHQGLNSSQSCVVDAVMDSSVPLVIVQGKPLQTQKSSQNFLTKRIFRTAGYWQNKDDRRCGEQMAMHGNDLDSCSIKRSSQKYCGETCRL